MKRPSFRRRRRPRSPMVHGQVGAPPGRFTVSPDAHAPTMRMFVYDEERCDERAITDPAEAAEARAEGQVVWLDVQGLGDADLMRRIGELFELSPMALEDTVHTHQRAKVEHYPGHTFMVAHMVHPAAEGLETEQISLHLGEDVLLTFQERPGDAFDPVRQRLRTAQGRIRRRPADYLAYALVDAAVDAYFPLLEAIGDRAEAIEEALFGDPDDAMVHEIHRLRRALSTFRRAVWPLRDALQSLAKGEDVGFIQRDTLPFLRDTIDHVLRALDLIESFRELATGLMDVYLSSVSHRMNEHMQLLSIIATIFIPLTFIAGIYGMNFDPEVSPWNMPELGWFWGYPFALFLMAATAGGMWWLFKRKGWIRRRRSLPPPDARE